MRTVKEILAGKPKAFNTISPHALVIDAINMLNTVNLSYLVIMDGDSYKGIFSERDYSRNVILKGRTSSSATVQEVMTRDLPIVELSDTLEHCIHMINMHKTRYLPAYDADRNLAGIITIHDLLRQVLTNKDGVNASLTEQLISNDEKGIY